MREREAASSSVASSETYIVKKSTLHAHFPVLDLLIVDAGGVGIETYGILVADEDAKLLLNLNTGTKVKDWTKGRSKSTFCGRLSVS